jgi:hypothetical protein
MTPRFCLDSLAICLLLEFVHAFIKFAQIQYIFVYDPITIIKVFKGDIYNIYCDPNS